jgi:4-hydroxy-2-oxoheptanedioate aldolase
MRSNWVREKLRAGTPSVGSFMGLGSPLVAEMLAHAGFDWLVIETEHNGMDMAQVQQMLMAMSGTETIPIVRVPSTDPVFIQRALDVGALGIVVPRIRSAAEAEAVVAQTRYPPHGERSFGPLRASHYSLDYHDYMERANDNILVALIYETRDAVDNVEAIAAVPGVDALYVGPFDLGLELGTDPRRGIEPPVDAAIEKMLRACKAHGVAAGMGDPSAAQLATWRDRGCTMLGLGPDYAMFLGVAREQLAAMNR